jgi:hypothetical protein
MGADVAEGGRPAESVAVVPSGIRDDEPGPLLRHSASGPTSWDWLASTNPEGPPPAARRCLRCEQRRASPRR